MTWELARHENLRLIESEALGVGPQSFPQALQVTLMHTRVLQLMLIHSPWLAQPLAFRLPKLSAPALRDCSGPQFETAAMEIVCFSQVHYIPR